VCLRTARANDTKDAVEEAKNVIAGLAKKTKRRFADVLICVIAAVMAGLFTKLADSLDYLDGRVKQTIEGEVDEQDLDSIIDQRLKVSLTRSCLK
jgi:hypothetical protein